MIDPYVEMEPQAKLIDVRNVEVNESTAEVTVSYTVRLLADLRVEGRVIDDDGNVLHAFVILRDQVLVVPYVARLVDGALCDVKQDDIAESHQGAVRFDDAYDAASWLYNDELSDWEHITVHPDREATDSTGAPTSFELHGPGRTERVTLSQMDTEELWRLEFEGSDAVITAYDDPGSRVWLGKGDSYDMYPPVELRSSYGHKWYVSNEPYTALAQVWAFLIGEEKPGAS
ncbi:hypothetical protein BST11_26600 [Mycobacterium alsense]|nr:hypothetical protein BST11_26600 [Mycobacterium alsense]